MPDDPFFIVGSDRSGTTVFRLMLNRHSRLHVPRESWFLPDLLDALPVETELGVEEVTRALAIVLGHPRWADWEVDDGDVERAVTALRSPRLAEVVDAVYRCSAGGAPRWGDKTPPYVHEIGRIHALFPSAKFLHVVRDGRDVCESLRAVGWHGRTTRELAGYWSDAVLAGREQERSLPPGRYHEVRYEELVLEPERTLRAACDFLGERFEPSMLSFYETAADEVAPHEMDRGYHTKTIRPPGPEDVGRWRREMPLRHQAVFEAFAGPAMDAMGHPRRFSGALRVVPAAARAGRAVFKPALVALRRQKR